MVNPVVKDPRSIGHIDPNVGASDSGDVQRTSQERRLRSVYFWATSGTLGAQGALWLLSLLVMRVLQPSDYGVVGVVTVFFSFCRTVQDAGLGPAIVQSPNLNRRMLNSVFWFFVTIGVLFAAASFMAAPLLGHMKSETQLPPVMRTLSFTFVIVGIRAVPLALMTRALHFKERSTAEILSAVIGSITTVILAYTHYGVWSIVIGNLLSETALAGLCWIYARWRPSLDCDWGGLKYLLRFGLSVTGSTLLWQFYVDSDFLMIGVLLGPQQLGLYTIAWQIGMIPADRLSAVLNKVNLPVFSTMRSDCEAIRSHWSRLTSIVAWTVFPIAAGVALVGGNIVRLFLTTKWAGSIPILPPLCILGGIRAITVILPGLLVAVGRPSKLLRCTFVCSVVYLPAFALSAHFGGVVWVAWTWVILSPPLYLWMIELSLPLTPLRLADYFVPLQAPFIITLVMSSMVWAAGKIVSVSNLSQLIIQVMIGSIVYCGLGILWLRKTDQLSVDRIGLRRI